MLSFFFYYKTFFHKSLLRCGGGGGGRCRFGWMRPRGKPSTNTFPQRSSTSSHCFFVFRAITTKVRQLGWIGIGQFTDRFGNPVHGKGHASIDGWKVGIRTVFAPTHHSHHDILIIIIMIARRLCIVVIHSNGE